MPGTVAHGVFLERVRVVETAYLEHLADVACPVTTLQGRLGLWANVFVAGRALACCCTAPLRVVSDTVRDGCLCEGEGKTKHALCCSPPLCWALAPGVRSDVIVGVMLLLLE